MPAIPLMAWLIGGASLFALTIGLNWWFALVETRTAVIALALVAIATSINATSTLWMRVAVNSVLILGALVFGTLDERARQSLKAKLSLERATQVANDRYAEYERIISEMQTVTVVIEKEAEEDPRAEEDSLSLDAIKRLNRLRGP